MNPSLHNTPTRNERCETCRYLMAGRQGWYECHRKEPQISIRKECDDEAINPVAIWPHVGTEDWCGQYAPQKQGGVYGKCR